MPLPGFHGTVDGVAAHRLDLAVQRIAGAGGEGRAPARFDAALGDRHRGRHDIDAAHQLVELVDRRLVTVGKIVEPDALDRASCMRGSAASLSRR